MMNFLEWFKGFLCYTVEGCIYFSVNAEVIKHLLFGKRRPTYRLNSNFTDEQPLSVLSSV